ncbi:PAAR domain-containing protein [Paraburkholderia guartelaensis]|uniref:PAAR domain-containing protein n=1 Tax=Paraburkholderia guartelaensis TaxID=2546446 RepID=A0A4R5LDM5_9BURK|nr:PAAR domain-containing protein [Paraburkholderia guartelaensis]TDG06239.1 PAAR domain-containing protein [Paraburkholderia guartelaensis]
MVARAKIRVGDKTSHGGTVIQGFPEMQCYGKPVAGLGHAVTCPKCSGYHKIVEGVASFSFNGTPIALDGMKTSCGAILIASQHLDVVELVSDANALEPHGASSEALQGGVHDEQVIEQWFGLEDEHGNPVTGYKYDLLKDGDMHTRAASFDSGQSTVVEGAADVHTVMWLDRDSVVKT